MKTCHEKDKVALFCERGLSDVEQAEFELHLKTCAECRKETEQLRADDALLREGVEEAFTRHRVNSRIMQQIRSEKISPVPASRQPQSGWRYFWLTALALLTVLAITSLYTPAGVKYHGRGQGLMVQALNDSSTLQGESLALDQSFKLEALKPIALDGCFLFTVTNGHTSVFKMSGKATVRLTEGQPEFCDSEATFELVSGARLNIIVNHKTLQLERKMQSAGAVSHGTEMEADRGTVADLGELPVATATTTEQSGAIIDSEDEEAVLIVKPAEDATATAEVLVGSETWVDPTTAPMKNPFADDTIDLNGN